MTKIPRFLRNGPKEPDTEPKVTFFRRYRDLFDERPHPWAPPAAKDKTRLQRFLARLRPRLGRRTGTRLISLHIAQTHAGTGRELDLDWR